MKRHIIWQDAIYENEEDWKEAFEEFKKDGEPYENSNIHDFIDAECNYSYGCEQVNINIEVPNGILVIADLGAWNGRKSGHLNHDLSNVNECLHTYCGGYLKVYLEDDLIAEEAHHDGTNVYTFRKWRDDVTEEQKDDLRIALWAQEKEKAADLIAKYTLSLYPEVAKAYGW